MPAFSRKVGSVSQNILLFVPDATVSTGAGLANIVASTVTFAWFRNGMSAASSNTLTTGTLGTWATSTMIQVNSTSLLGWYQVSIPDGALAAGDHVALHLYGAPSMAPVPVFIDLSTDIHRVASPVGVSTVTIPVGVSSISTPVGVTTGVVSVSSATIPFGVSSISTPVTASTAGVTSISIPVGVSTGSIAVSSATAGVNEGVADALLLRNVSSGGNTGRTVREAFYAIRNRVDLTNGIVYATDDTTSSWAFTTSTSAVDPVVEIDPS